MISPKTTPVTNDLNSLLVSLDDIASHSGSKVKESLLEYYLDYTVFRHLVDLLLNPYKRYGITSYNPEPPFMVKHPITLNEVFDFFGDLEKRKITGNDARDMAGVYVKGGFPGELMTRILNKDPKAGFGTTMVNKVMKGLLPEFPYMRCSLPEKSNMKKWDWDKGIFSQLKADGMYMNVDHDDAGQVQLMSRQGSIFPVAGFEHFHGMVRDSLKRGTQTHGEMVVYVGGELQNRQTGNGIINSVVQGGSWPLYARIQFLAWDQIPLSAVQPKGKYKVSYRERFNDLSMQLSNTGTMYGLQPIETVMVKSKKQAYEHFQEKLLLGLEGTVVKDPEMPWADGTSLNQVKLKLAFVVDLKMVGVTEGNGKFAKTFGAIKMESQDGLLKTDVSGMDDKTRQLIYDNLHRYMYSVMAVEANAIFKPSKSNPLHALSHPRFVDFCEKPDADTLHQIFNQELAAIDAAAEIN